MCVTWVTSPYIIYGHGVHFISSFLYVGVNVYSIRINTSLISEPPSCLLGMTWNFRQLKRLYCKRSLDIIRYTSDVSNHSCTYSQLKYEIDPFQIPHLTVCKLMHQQQHHLQWAHAQPQLLNQLLKQPLHTSYIAPSLHGLCSQLWEMNGKVLVMVSHLDIVLHTVWIAIV